jgi:hypothetical protein
MPATPTIRFNEVSLIPRAPHLADLTESGVSGRAGPAINFQLRRLEREVQQVDLLAAWLPRGGGRTRVGVAGEALDGVDRKTP